MFRRRVVVKNPEHNQLVEIGSRKIALVISDDAMRDALAMSLSTRGFVVERFRIMSGFLAGESNPHCLVIDLLTRDPSQHQEARDLRAELGSANVTVPVLLLANSSRISDRIRKEMQVEILVKPVEPKVFVQVVGGLSGSLSAH